MSAHCPACDAAHGTLDILCPSAHILVASLLLFSAEALGPAIALRLSRCLPICYSRKVKRQELMKQNRYCIWDNTPSPSVSPERGPSSDEE